MAEHEKKRRKTFHSWLDLEAEVERKNEEEGEDDAWEIGVCVLGMVPGHILTGT